MSKLVRFLENLKLNLRYGLIIKKQRLLKRVALSYLRGFCTSETPLRYIDFATDYTCNLRCEHCFATALEKPGARRMSIKDYQRVAKETLKMGVFHFSFQGGEPLIDKRLPEIIKAFKPDRSYISVTTNGLLLSRETILQLKSWGVDKINISLDSMVASEHDRFRGVSGTFDRAWEGMLATLKEGLKVTINTTVSHQNIHSEGIKKLLNWAIKNKVIINPIFAAPLGRWEDNREILMTKEDREHIDKFRQKSTYVRRDMDSNYKTFGCPAVKEVLYITPYGDVLPCPFLHLNLGNVLEEPLERIRNRALEYEIFRKYHQACLASEDRKFMKRYLSAISGKKPLPVDVKEVLGNV